mmetsp:Transcript_42121/g.78288  ORF Transcript_42121/g.78288 Transcript_42121/m.78288 type:complete len:351 (+) Transcript_42121:64-1116(+)
MELKKIKPGRAKKRKDRQWEYIVWAGGTAGSVLLGCAVVLFGSDAGTLETLVNDESFIGHVNINARSWQAGAASCFKGWIIGDVRKQMGGINISNRVSGLSECALPDVDVPEVFDARQKWPLCFLPPYEMGNCSASWALAAAASLSQRICIASPRKHASLRLSPQQLLSCDTSNKGCQGGSLDTVWDYMMSEGLVSESCFPYQANGTLPCSICDEEPMRLACVCRLSTSQIRREIFLHGPIVAAITLMNDFLVYRSGVYQETKTASQFVDVDRQRQMHAVTVLGWGREGTLNYWIIESSWGQDWGEGGYAKVVDGGKKSNLMEFAFAGTPVHKALLPVGEEAGSQTSLGG